MYFSHPECLPYSGTWTVYFVTRNYVYAFQSPRVSPLFSDSDCLLCCAGLKSNFVYAFHSLGVSPLFRDSEWLRYNEKLCLHYSVTWTVYIVQALGFEVSTLFLHTECLLYYGIIRKTNVCISMACVFTIPTAVFLVMSSGVVYVVLALGVSSLVCPPPKSLHLIGTVLCIKSRLFGSFHTKQGKMWG